MPKVTILGVAIDSITMDAGAKAIADYAVSGDSARFVTKPYVEFLDLASKQSEIRDLLNQSLLVLPDSVAIQWAALYQSQKGRSAVRLIKTLSDIVLQPNNLTKVIPERFAGADFTWIMLRTAAQQNATVYLIGHPQGSNIASTAAFIESKLPTIRIIGTFDGYQVQNSKAELIADLKIKKPNLILVGIGFPRQEILMAELSSVLESGVLVGEGGTFDYESFGGKIKRAPVWMRRSGLEWLWRLLLQPKRLVRQLAIPRFIWKVYRSHGTDARK